MVALSVPVINLVGKDSIQSIVTDGAAVADRAIDGSDSTDVDDDTCAISSKKYVLFENKKGRFLYPSIFYFELVGREIY